MYLRKLFILHLHIYNVQQKKKHQILVFLLNNYFYHMQIGMMNQNLKMI